MYAKNLADRAESVRRIGISRVPRVVVESPHALITRAVGRIQIQRAQVVDIGSLDVHHFAEQPSGGHVQRRHLEKVVTAVLEHHAVAARAFGGVDELPALIDRHGCRNLERDMLAAFHRIDGDRRVQFPWRTVVYQIDVVALAHLFPVLLAGVCGRLGQSGSGQYPLRPLDGPRTYVAQRDDLNALQMREALDGHRTPHAEPDECHAHGRNRIAAQLQHVRLSFLAAGLGEHERAVFDLGSLAVASGGQGDGPARQQDGQPAFDSVFHECGELE